MKPYYLGPWTLRARYLLLTLPRALPYQSSHRNGLATNPKEGQVTFLFERTPRLTSHHSQESQQTLSMPPMPKLWLIIRLNFSSLRRYGFFAVVPASSWLTLCQPWKKTSCWLLIFNGGSSSGTVYKTGTSQRQSWVIWLESVL